MREPGPDETMGSHHLVQMPRPPSQAGWYYFLFFLSCYMQTTNHSPSALHPEEESMRDPLRHPLAELSWDPKTQDPQIYKRCSLDCLHHLLPFCNARHWEGVWRGRNMGWRFLTVHIDKTELIPQPLAGRQAGGIGINTSHSAQTFVCVCTLMMCMCN
jgi:hypothetical protein